MNAKSGFRRFRRFSFGSGDAAEEVDRELSFHLEEASRELMATGLDARAAREEAERRFGPVEHYREECRALSSRRQRARRRGELLAGLGLDLRAGLRSLQASPAFTLGTVLTLALALGASTAVFSVVYGCLLKPLPLPQPDRLVHLWEENPEKGWTFNVAAPANFLDWRARSTRLAGLSAASSGRVAAALSTGAGEPEPVLVAEVYPDYFTVLGVKPLLGRTFREEEAWAGAPSPVLLSEGLWRSRFGGDPALVGRSITLNGRQRTVIGIVPAGFAFPFAEQDLWVTFSWEPGYKEQVWFRRAHWLLPIGRLKPGATVAEARAELETLAAQLGKEHPETNRVMGAGLMPLDRWLGRERSASLWLLLGAVGLVLAVACANLTNLQLARSAPRRGELEVRAALGASRGRLVRQLLLESLALFGVGGALGLAAAAGLLEVLLAFAPQDLPRRAEIALHPAVLAFACALTLVCSLASGLAPALLLSRSRRSTAALGAGRRLSGGPGAGWQGRLLAGAEVALALVLSLGAALLLRNFLALERVDPGFDAREVMTAQLHLPGVRYGEEGQALAFFQQLLERLRGRPGVSAVALADALPLAGTNWTSDFSIAGRGPEDYGVEVNHRSVSPEYFSTMRVPLLAGRAFDAGDRAGNARGVVINQELARRYFPGQNPIGQRLCFDRVPNAESAWRTIVGVVGTESVDPAGRPARIEILTPFSQEESGDAYVLLRGARGSGWALGELRAAIAGLDRQLPLFDIASLDERIARSLSRERFLTRLLMFFAAAALALAAVGIYSVLAYGVSRRRREIGIRMALGAGSESVLSWVFRQAGSAIVAGLAVGLAGSLACSRLLAGQLFAVSPTDPATYAGVVALLAVVAAAASLLPARRAARVDPAVTLREE